MVNLSDQVKDKITGFKGTVVGKVEYINGCVKYSVQPKIDKDGKMPDSIWIDEQELEITKKAAKKKTKPKGGPVKNLPKDSHKL